MNVPLIPEYMRSVPITGVTPNAMSLAVIETIVTLLTIS